MTQEDRELLLKDLCARLPYHPKCDCYWKEKPQNGTVGYVTELTTYEFDQFMYADKFDDIPIREIKPYLRPMSSMTDEECEQYRKFSYYGAAGYRYNDYKVMVAAPSFEKMDFLNAHHFDYRGLIEKGLALEAPDDMYK